VLQVLSTAPLAVVEIDSEWALLVLAAAVFLVVLAAVLAVAYLLVRAKKRPGPGPTSTFEVNLGGRLPVSKTTFDRLEKVTVAAFSKPEVTPEKRAYLDRLSRSRAIALKMYRILMLVAGLIGMAVAVALWRDATPGNMQLLPASIILLLSVAALLNAWFPSRSLRAPEPFEPGLLDRINVQVLRPQPTTLTISEADVERYAQFTRQGLSPEEAAQAAYSDFERLDEAEKQALLLGLEKSAKGARPRPPF
jgi:hypothetical protein